MSQKQKEETVPSGGQPRGFALRSPAPYTCVLLTGTILCLCSLTWADLFHTAGFRRCTYLCTDRETHSHNAHTHEGTWGSHADSAIYIPLPPRTFQSNHWSKPLGMNIDPKITYGSPEGTGPDRGQAPMGPGRIQEDGEWEGKVHTEVLYLRPWGH